MKQLKLFECSNENNNEFEKEKEIRFVWTDELNALGLKTKNFEKPVLTGLRHRYYKNGRIVAIKKSGCYFYKPQLIVKEPFLVEEIDIQQMIDERQSRLNNLEQNAIKFIKQTYLEFKKQNSGIFVAFSGGKDSVVLLDLVSKALEHHEFKVVFSDTTMELPTTYETLEQVKQKYKELEFIVAKAKKDALENWKLFGPPSRINRWCCHVHKSAPALIETSKHSKNKNTFLVFSGVRRKESHSRKKRQMVEEKTERQMNARPILNWNSLDVWLYIFKYNLPINKAYKLGFSRVGCLVCPFHPPSTESLVALFFKNEAQRFLNILKDYALDFKQSEVGAVEYIMSGAWKMRREGKGRTAVYEVEVEESDGFLFVDVFKDRFEAFKRWCSIAGVKIADIEEKEKAATVKCVGKKKYVKCAAVKANYCVSCGLCESYCKSSSLKIDADGNPSFFRCERCLSCLEVNFRRICARYFSIKKPRKGEKEND